MMFTSAVFFRAGAPLARELVSEPPGPESRLAGYADPGKKVAFAGLGGLGHVAVRLARAMGAAVTVLSQSPAKQDHGLRLGADRHQRPQDLRETGRPAPSTSS